MLCCGEYHVWSTSTDSNFFFHVRQNTYTVIKISAWSKEGADVPCTVCCHNHLFASKGGFQSISSTCYRRCAVVNVWQICDSLKCFYRFRRVNGAFRAIFAVISAAIGFCPYFQLPWQCVNGTSVNIYIVRIKIRIQSILSIDIQSQLLCCLDKSIPIPCILSICRRSHLWRIDSLLLTNLFQKIVVVPKVQNFVCCRICNWCAVVTECQTIQRFGIAFTIHRADVCKKSVLCKFQHAGLTHNTGIRKLTSCSHGIQLGNVGIVIDLHYFYFDLVLFAVELISNCLCSCCLSFISPLCICDLYSVTICCKNRNCCSNHHCTCK